ncbi:hypothetical protein NDU88_004988 [Pleurodeles waltl]|uniref:Uncharacterized protein n=1 Tax=Pleurodeles waltl TaxID=8319 RepID=A0AAV7QGJ2_PLEWA|nr:hypothetical protein NDU88_004988 [Pleurodeles waltl]
MDGFAVPFTIQGTRTWVGLPLVAAAMDEPQTGVGDRLDSATEQSKCLAAFYLRFPIPVYFFGFRFVVRSLRSP